MDEVRIRSAAEQAADDSLNSRLVRIEKGLGSLIRTRWFASGAVSVLLGVFGTVWWTHIQAIPKNTESIVALQTTVGDLSKDIDALMPIKDAFIRTQESLKNTPTEVAQLNKSLQDASKDVAALQKVPGELGTLRTAIDMSLQDLVKRVGDAETELQRLSMSIQESDAAASGAKLKVDLPYFTSRRDVAKGVEFSYELAEISDYLRELAKNGRVTIRDVRLEFEKPSDQGDGDLLTTAELRADHVLEVRVWTPKAANFILMTGSRRPVALVQLGLTPAKK